MPHDSLPPVSASASESSGLDRRDFLKTVGAAVLAAGALPSRRRTHAPGRRRRSAAPRPPPCPTSPIS